MKFFGMRRKQHRLSLGPDQCEHRLFAVPILRCEALTSILLIAAGPFVHGASSPTQRHKRRLLRSVFVERPHAQ